VRRSVAPVDAGAPRRASTQGAAPRSAGPGRRARAGGEPGAGALRSGRPATYSLARELALSRHALEERGVDPEDLAVLVRDLQLPYLPGLTMEECRVSVDHVLAKREVCHALLTGLALDRLAEQGLLPGALGGIVQRDDPLYGIDEVLALSIVNIYGTIGLTNFGYLDKVKPGVVGRTDAEGRDGRHVNTFLDDLLAAVAAAAAARLAHRYRDAEAASREARSSPGAARSHPSKVGPGPPRPGRLNWGTVPRESRARSAEPHSRRACAHAAGTGRPGPPPAEPHPERLPTGQASLPGSGGMAGGR
jgi:phosphatidylglycerophosphatase A